MPREPVPLPELGKIAKPKELLRWAKLEGIRFLYGLLRPKPNLVAEMNWNNLIVLDACRFDAFAQVNDIPGTLTKIVSVASCTWNWFPNNFSDRAMKDVVYISANPYGSYYWLHKTLGHIPFYEVVEVWKDGWSEKLKTVHPSEVNKRTFESLTANPHKRHIIHYMQPHHPFIGNVTLLDIDSGDWTVRWRDRIFDQVSEQKELDAEKPNVFALLEQGVVNVKRVWRAYMSNLQLVMDYVKKLLPALNGRICITSDHGELFGRFGVFYGHPAKTPLPELIEVPWLEVSKEESKSPCSVRN